MSFIDDIPFDGDNSTPLTESLKKRITAAELSYKNRSSFDIDLTPADLRFYEFIAEGNTSAQKSAEEAELEAELNRVRLEVEINAIRRRMQQKQDIKDKQQAVFHSIDLYIEKHLEKAIKVPLKYLTNYRDMSHYKRIFSELGDDRLSISRLTSLIGSCDWLSKEIINFVNSTGYKNKFKTKEAKDLQQAINLLNVRGVTILIPKLVIEKNIRSYSGYMKKPWQRLLQYQQITSMCAFLLARHQNRNNAYKTYLISAINMFPEFLLLNMLAILSKEGQNYARQTATHHQDDFRMQSIDSYEPSANIVANLMTLSEIIKPLVVDAFNFNNIPMMPVLEGEEEHFDEFSIIQKAKGFTIFRLLMAAQMDKKEEVIQLLKHYGMDNSSLQYLQSIDFKSIDIYELLAIVNSK